MNLRPLLLVLLALLGASTASAQIEASLYTRVEDGVVRAAIEVEMDFEWHLYDPDLGHPDAIGAPTVVELDGAGITWGPPSFPEPHQHDQSDVAGPGVFINIHEDEFVLYLAGRLDEGATVETIGGKLSGLMCDPEGCIPFNVKLASKGAGADELFADFPADLVPKAPGVKVPARDEMRGGRADATLYTRIEGKHVKGVLLIEVDLGWHLYHTEKGNPDGIGKVTELTYAGEGVKWHEAVWPEPERFDQSDIFDGAWIFGHEGEIKVYLSGTVEDGYSGEDAWVELVGQTCDEEACIDYAETVVSQGRGDDALFADFPSGTPEAGGGGQGAGDEEPQGLLAFLLQAVLWGFITLLMPCTYPMIPITISFFTKQADARGGKVLPLSAAYGFGIVAIFALIGVVFGAAIIPFATHWVTNLVIGAAFVYFAFVLFGAINMQPPRFLMQAAGKAQSTGGYLGVFLMGATLVVTSFTCTAPFVGTLLASGAADGDLTRVILGMSTFGLTMAIPFVILSLVPGRIQAMPKSGEWMNTLKFTLGFVELAAALKFLSNADVVLGWGILSREVFLGLWTAIFLAAALYLFGVLRFKGGKPRVGVGRLSSGALLSLMAAYSLWGFLGKEVDDITTSIIPPYSSFVEEDISWAMVLDDYDQALAQAEAEGKLVLVNFTGHT